MKRGPFPLFKLILHWVFVVQIGAYIKKWFFNGRVFANNKAVLVTGCSTGFGNLLTRKLDALGFKVFATSRNPQDPAVQKLRKECSTRLEICALDVRVTESVERLLEHVRHNLGSTELWAVVNNAGVQYGYTTDFSSIKDFENTLDVNILGTIRVTKTFLPLLRETQGRIINVGSPLENLRQELRLWGISVISVEPELFQTNMTSQDTKKNFAEMISGLDDSIRSCYGELYFSIVQNMQDKVVDSASPDVDIAVDALLSAVTVKYPEEVYKPRRNLLTQLVFYLVEGWIPQSLVDFLFYDRMCRILQKSLRSRKRI